MATVYLVAAVLALVLLLSLAKLGRVEEYHHGFWGIAVIALQWSLDAPVWLAWLGLMLLLDDTVQHFVEAIGLRPRMADFTPIHKLGAWLMGLNWKGMGWYAPVGIVVLLAAAAIFCAIHWGT